MIQSEPTTVGNMRYRVWANGVVEPAPERRPDDFTSLDFLVVWAPGAFEAYNKAWGMPEYQLLRSQRRFNITLRTAAVLGVIVLALSALSGCGGGDPEGDERPSGAACPSVTAQQPPASAADGRKTAPPQPSRDSAC